MKRSLILTGLVFGVVVPLAGCAGSDLERSLAADPRLQSPTGSGSVSSTPAATAVNLPADFPSEIPLYPGATLQMVLVAPNQSGADQADPASPPLNATTGEPVQFDPGTATRWQTSDAPEQVRQWYQQRFSAEGWQVQSAVDAAVTDPLVAVQNGLRVVVSVQSAGSPTAGGATPAPAPTSITGTVAPTPATAPATGGTAFSLEYVRTNTTVGVAPSPAAGETTGEITTNSELVTVPQPGDPSFIGPVLPPELAGAIATPTPIPPTPTTSVSPVPQSTPDLAQVPTQLQPYIADLLSLGSLKTASGQVANLQPNQPITRREFARWLVATNNQVFANRPANQIRLAVAGSQATFQDVPSNDPDFPAIQGLAEAGLIPSPLSGDTTTLTFRPDAPLVRESLVLWKVPLDTGRVLPTATVDLIQQTWGFQDAPQINPRALRAIAADYQNGEQSNIRRAFGFTTLLQPGRPVTQAEAAAALWFFGKQGDGISVKDALQAAQRPAQ